MSSNAEKAQVQSFFFFKSVFHMYLTLQEDYDFERISSQGFALITSQQVPLPCVCYLCGSAGQEKVSVNMLVKKKKNYKEKKCVIFTRGFFYANDIFSLVYSNLL